MSLETALQGFIRTFEQGQLAVWVKRLVILVVIAGITILWAASKFNGFNTAEAMDQAQIGRQLATGQGYTTLQIRPLALHLMILRTGQVRVPLPEVNQPPLGPFINAVVLKIGGNHLGFRPGDSIYPAERALTLVGLVFFLASLAVLFLLARRLFDPKTALFGCGMIVVMDIFWRFSFSGLPQMVLLFFFSASLLLLLLAMEAQDRGRRGRTICMAVLAALSLGMMTLGHGAGLFIFAGFWIFAVIVLQPRILMAVLTPAAFALPLLPWAWHNWRALRNPFGLPFYELLYRKPGADPLELAVDFEPMLRFRFADFWSNTSTQAIDQMTNIVSFFGGSLVAVAFFLAVLLHTFIRWQPAQLRWAVLLMWLGAFAGMAVFGVKGSVSANQLHILFVPVMTFYGLDFLLSLWSRLEIDQPLLRGVFIFLLYAMLAWPLASGLMNTPKLFNWPPYLPPLVERFQEWLEPREALAADIPWATAWYANRRSLLLPRTVDQFDLINGEGLLGGPIVGIYFTPVSTDAPFYSGIANGYHSDWSRFMLRLVTPEELQDWTMTTLVKLPLNDEATFYSDRVRWQ